MAIGWFSILSKVVPWGDVIDAAPQIVKGAKRLFRSTRGEAVDATRAAVPPAPLEPESLADLNTRVRRLQAKVVEMETEQKESAALIQSLAEQNARVVGAIEVIRKRTRVLTYSCAANTVAIIAMAVWLAVRAV